MLQGKLLKLFLGQRRFLSRLRSQSDQLNLISIADQGAGGFFRMEHELISGELHIAFDQLKDNLMADILF